MNMQPVDVALITKKRRIAPLRAFEVSIFNRDVRACLKDNEDHPVYSERWCDPQKTILLARDEVDLASKVRAHFPVEAGFVVENIVERRRPRS